MQRRGVVHQSKYGTYHPDPQAEVAWTIQDTRGYIDRGPPCSECGYCDCLCIDGDGYICCCDECMGMSFAIICLEGEALCTLCAEDVVEIIPCDCN
jgi:hypothetical protein